MRTGQRPGPIEWMEPDEETGQWRCRLEVNRIGNSRGPAAVDDLIASLLANPELRVAVLSHFWSPGTGSVAPDSPGDGLGASAASSETRCEFFDRMVNRRCRKEPGHQGPHVYRMNDDEESSEAELSAGEGSERVTHEQPEAAGPHPIRLTHENARQWTIELTGQRPSWRRDLFAYIDQQTAQQEQSEREVASLTSELATAREMIYDAERREEALREELATAQQELEDAWRNDKPITNDQMILNLEEQLRFCYEFRARPLPGGYGPVHAFRKELVEALRELASLVDADLAPRHIAWEKLASRLERGVHQ